jgi:hypothetical protein
VVRRFPYVLVVCTLRTGCRSVRIYDKAQAWLLGESEFAEGRTAFADEALPETVQRLEMPDFGEETWSAVERYFNYYHIVIGDADLPIFLSHPLTLRLFCEVTNPDRQNQVGIEAMPGSLTALFERFLKQAADRIGELASHQHKYLPQDVHKAYLVIGLKFWEKRSRTLSESEVRAKLRDEQRPWNLSIIRALEQEGVILRTPGHCHEDMQVMAVYDALAGHLCAASILVQKGRDGFEAWLKSQATRDALWPSSDSSPSLQPEADKPEVRNPESIHPLAQDIFRAFVGLIPRRFSSDQLWQMLEEPLRTEALIKASYLEASYLDEATVEALANLTASGRAELFKRFHQTRSSPVHPLNAEFLDSVLRKMSLAERDLRWTEWVRAHHKFALSDLTQLETKWAANPERTAEDLLRARWIVWLLSSTVHPLRDQATRALYSFGRGNPAALFDMTVQCLGINDPYIAERMLAASYGVAMAKHADFNDETFTKETLPKWGRTLYHHIFSEEADFPTTHVLAREYASRLLELTLFHHGRLLTPTERARTKPPYGQVRVRNWKEQTSETEFGGLTSPFRMDFENYTLGHLAQGRSPYDFSHPEYVKVRAQILWRVQDLGWSQEMFGKIDHEIETRTSYARSEEESKKTIRYGKKYSRIAYFELAGKLQDERKLDNVTEQGRPWEVDLDPSFPMPIPQGALISEDFLGKDKMELQCWITDGQQPNLVPYLALSHAHKDPGPWLMLDGYFAQQDDNRGRRIFCFVRSFFVKTGLFKEFFGCLSRQNLGGRWLPEKPDNIYTFAGEIPWCKTFPLNGWTSFRFGETSFLRGMQANAADLQRNAKRLQAFIPVRTFGWEGTTLEGHSLHATTLAKEVAAGLRLVSKPQTFDLFTREGAKVTWAVSDHKDFNNSQQFLFIRGTALKSYLQKNRLSMLWAIWGERECSTKFAEDRAGLLRPKIPYKVYQKILSLDLNSLRVKRDGFG